MEITDGARVLAVYHCQVSPSGHCGKITELTTMKDHTIYTLYDYRKRIATYRTDLDLLLSHQQFPWIPVWDDHDKSQITIAKCETTNTFFHRWQITPTEYVKHQHDYTRAEADSI